MSNAYGAVDFTSWATARRTSSATRSGRARCAPSTTSGHAVPQSCAEHREAPEKGTAVAARIERVVGAHLNRS